MMLKQGLTLQEFVGLKAKTYSYLLDDVVVKIKTHKEKKLIK